MAQRVGNSYLQSHYYDGFSTVRQRKSGRNRAKYGKILAKMDSAQIIGWNNAVEHDIIFELGPEPNEVAHHEQEDPVH